jgi:hypothetical protein
MEHKMLNKNESEEEHLRGITDFPGTGEAPLDGVDGEPPDEASDDSLATKGEPVIIPREVALHGPKKQVEEAFRKGVK